MDEQPCSRMAESAYEEPREDQVAANQTTEMEMAEEARTTEKEEPVGETATPSQKILEQPQSEETSI